MKNYDFTEINNYIYFTEDTYDWYEPSPLRVLMTKSSKNRFLNCTYKSSKEVENVKNIIFEKGGQRKIQHLFDQGIIFDLWVRIPDDEKECIYDSNMRDGNNLSNTWTFPIGEKKKFCNSSGKKEKYWQITAMPLNDKQGNTGYLYLSDKNEKPKRKWGLNNSRVFKTNGPKQKYNFWDALYSVWEEQEKPGFFLGGTVEPNFNLTDIKKIQNNLVTKTELDKYTMLQNSKFAEKYINTNSSKFSLYLQKKQQAREADIPIITSDNRDVIRQVNSVLRQKSSELKKMIEPDQVSDRAIWNENDYQKILLEIFPFIFPQYTHFIREYQFKIDNNLNKKSERPDFLAATTNLSVDVIEIKKPDFEIFKRGTYRGNSVFSSEVQGLISQIQKYIFNLERNAEKEESKITQTFKNKTDFDCGKSESLRVRSPKAIVVIGRKPNSDEKIRDFEIYKRRYQDIEEFLTYDDILDRIDRIINRQTGTIKN